MKVIQSGTNFSQHYANKTSAAWEETLTQTTVDENNYVSRLSFYKPSQQWEMIGVKYFKEQDQFNAIMLKAFTQKNIFSRQK